MLPSRLLQSVGSSPAGQEAEGKDLLGATPVRVDRERDALVEQDQLGELLSTRELARCVGIEEHGDEDMIATYFASAPAGVSV